MYYIELMWAPKKNFFPFLLTVRPLKYGESYTLLKKGTKGNFYVSLHFITKLQGEKLYNQRNFKENSVVQTKCLSETEERFIRRD